MADRPFLSPQNVITNGAMAGNLTSKPTVMKNLTKAAYSYSWTGSTPVGTVSVQVSNDYALNPDGTVLNAGTWSTATVSYNGTQVTTVPVTGNTGNGFIELDTGAYAVRTIYTAGSGTGNMQVLFCGKVY